MSSSQNNDASKPNDSKHSERVDTDSVHSRFRPLTVRCDICNMDIVGNQSAIEKHFDNSHPTKKYCCYCKGKVYSYIQMTLDSPIEKSEEVFYHKCGSS